MNIPELLNNIIIEYVDLYFPKSQLGRPRKYKTTFIIHYIFKVLRTGIQWKELYVPNGNYKTIYNIFNKWTKKKIFMKSFIQLLELYLKQRKPKYYVIDSSFIKSIFGVDCIGRNPTDRGRNATKLSVLFSVANKNDCTLLEPTVQNTHSNFISGIPFLADKGYDSKTCRSCINKLKLKDLISKRNHKTTNEKQRYIVENFFSWIDLFRRIILRYDKLISTFSEFHYFAFGYLLSRRLQC